jgi:hypothetical protein
MSEGISPSLFTILESKIGKRVLVVLDRSFGFEGIVATVSQDPPGIWLSDAEAVTLRSTLGNPLPQVTSRQDKSELFINLSHVLRVEVVH